MSNTRLFTFAATALVAASIGCGGSIDISPPSIPNAVQNQPYSTQLVGTGAQPVSWKLSAGALPAGVTLDAKSGLISGTPTAAGSFTFTIKGQDNSTFSSNTGTENYVLTVIPQLEVSSTLPNATAETPYSASILATGGVAPYTMVVTGLHAGLSFDSSSNTISGTPPLATMYTVTITVTDSGTPSQTKTVMQQLLILPPNVVITTSVLPTGHVSQSYTAPIATEHGSGDFVWGISNGLLPTGLSLNTSTGTISGSPTTPGMTMISVTVTDNGAQAYAATAAFVLNVVSYSAVQINTAALPAGTVGTAYTQSIVAIEGSGTFVFSVDTGTLPAGLDLDEHTGIISGTPTTAGISTFDIEVTDVNSPPDAAHQSYTLSIGT